MGQGTLREVRDGLGDPRGGLGQVGGPLGRSGTGWGTFWEVQDGLENLGEVWVGSMNS